MNPSFENFKKCPEKFGTFQDQVLFWSHPTIGSTDYFNKCSSNMSLDQNFLGGQESFHGNAYAGIYAYGPKNYREYIQGKLKEKLQKDNKYIVSARISLSERSEFGISEFGFLFSRNELNFQMTENISNNVLVKRGGSNYATVVNSNHFSDKANWVEVKGEYIAKGTEQYLSFGNFKSNIKTKTISTGANLKKVAYYYVDMVAVHETGKPYNLDEVYVFENLNFDTDEFSLEGVVQEQLHAILNYLNENPSLNIAIYGHTDNVGNAEYNSILSNKRAKTVGLFFADNGLSPLRIAWQGYGNSKPILSNATKKGREKNRRVEFIISKKNREFYASGLFEDVDND